MKSIADQIADVEACIERLKDASKRVFVLSDGKKKRFLDTDEQKALAQLATAENRAHAQLQALRKEIGVDDEALDLLAPTELLARIEDTQKRLDEMRKKLKPKALSG